MLYTFGKIVEEEEGSGAVWFTYVVCAVGTHKSWIHKALTPTDGQSRIDCYGALWSSTAAWSAVTGEIAIL